MDAENVKPSVFLLVGISNGIQPINFTPKPLFNYLWGNQLTQMAVNTVCLYLCFHDKFL